MLEIRDQFYMDGEPFQIISGAFHYFRTVPEYWLDRLEKVRNMGCNTVETYIPWNFHEEKEGVFNFSGMRDVEHFLSLAESLGLYVILRPSPYICSEWEFGGLPAWLLKDKNMKVRCSYPPYLEAVKRYYQELIPRLARHQIDRGGTVILVQIENEYGYYGNDKEYLGFLRDTMRELGITVPFVTSDGPWNKHVFRAGGIDGVLQTGNFGSAAEWQFEQMKKVMGNEKPMMCMEFWNGWFDAWGEEHHTTEPDTVAKELDELLKRGSVNFYMLEGGTNFGFMSGRNAGNLHADVTSYEYDAPLTEDGRITRKYEACREVIRKYRDFEEQPLTMEIKQKAYGKLSCCSKVSLLSTLKTIAESVCSLNPQTMEELGQNYGYILYRVTLDAAEAFTEIVLEGAADRAIIMENGHILFTLEGQELYEVKKVEDHEDAGAGESGIEQEGESTETEAGKSGAEKAGGSESERAAESIVKEPEEIQAAELEPDTVRGVFCRVTGSASGRTESDNKLALLEEKAETGKAIAGQRGTGSVIDILVENIGRENFGTNLDNQRKGISGGIKINGFRHYNVEQFTLPLNEVQLDRVDEAAGYKKGTPAFYGFEFEAEEKADTFLRTDGFGRGAAFINGFNLGRFDQAGPQKTLYIPAPLLKQGKNKLVIFESEGISCDTVELVDHAELG